MDKFDNIWQHSMIEHVFEDGTVKFQGEASIKVDVIIHCTGYQYHIPFLKTKGLVVVEENRVVPTYGHVFLPQLAPRLSFVGLFNMGMTFLPAELQSKWISQALSGNVLLPSEKEMMHDVEQVYKQMEERGIPKTCTHSLNHKMDYMDWLSDQLKITRPPQKLKDFYARFIERFHNDHEGFREAFEDNLLIEDGM
ncbi:hypothetical protein L2E82_41257 [Cichorium intybus]|uniref:Uncharacterized protein n=1 Tax=Cichorium intybus TaxID=13427 RepID=A0ACB9AP55_CICIN|nr:hypothetical protein L2E82_41257 [Cichorium intybus]